MGKFKVFLIFIIVVIGCFLLVSCSKSKPLPINSLSFEYFKADIVDVLVGDDIEVTFTASIISESKIDKISVQAENGNTLGYLYDDSNGNEKSEDKIFVGKILMKSDEEKHENIVAVVDNIKSQTIDIFFYTELTEADLNQLNAINVDFSEIQQKYLDAEGYVKESDIEALLSSVVDYLKEQNETGLISKYEYGSNCVYLELSNGIGYMFIPNQKDVLNSGTAKRITTVEPARNSFAVTTSLGFTWLTKKYNNLEYQGGYDVASNAKMIAQADNSYSYNIGTDIMLSNTEYLDADDDHFINTEVSIDSIKQLAGSRLVIWEGHGGYSDEIGSALITGESASILKNLQEYSADLKEKRLVTTGGWYTLGTDYLFCDYAVTSKFFEHYYSDKSFSDCLIYFGACYSGTDDRLASSFLNKGAKAVYCSKGSINMEYEMLMRTTIFYNLLKQAENGEYYTVDEALKAAWNIIGSYDSSNEGTYITYYGDGRFRLVDNNTITIDKPHNNSVNIEANGDDFLKLRELLDEYYVLVLSEYNFAADKAEDIISGLICNGYSIPGLIYYFEDMEIDVMFSSGDNISGVNQSRIGKDPLDKFTKTTGMFYKMPADKVDWVIENIFNARPDHSINTNYLYYFEGFYYHEAGDAGYIGHWAEIQDYEYLADGKYSIICRYYSVEYDDQTGKWVKGNELYGTKHIVADLKEINYKKYWTFYSIENYRKDSAEQSLNEDEHGNSVGNIVNGGLVAQSGDWVFYQHTNNGFKLYKMREDGTKKTKLNDDISYCINAVGDWIYYINNKDGNQLIYKIRTDGSENTKLNDSMSMSMHVIGDWIYYSKYCGDGDWKLHKMHTDGSEEIKLSDESIGNISISGDWVYFVNYGDKNSLYKIRTDGSEKTKLCDDYGSDINIVGDWIYYTVGGLDDKVIYKIRTDGSEKTKLNDDGSFHVNVVGDWIYYSNWNDNSLYKIRTDGSENTKLNDDDSIHINVVGEWIYYTIDFGNGDLYRIRIDGTEKQIIT